MSSKTLSSPRACRQSLKTLSHVDVLYLVFLFWYPSFILSKSTSDISGNLLVSNNSTKYSSNMPHETSSNSHVVTNCLIYTFALCEDRYALIGSIFISLFFTRFHWLITSCPNYQVIFPIYFQLPSNLDTRVFLRKNSLFRCPN